MRGELPSGVAIFLTSMVIPSDGLFCIPTNGTFFRCWSNYLGRQPQLSGAHITVPKFEVFPEEDAETWSPYSDTGPSHEHSQPSRTRAVFLQISLLCEISGDLLSSFYHPTPMGKPMGKQEELRRLTHLHTRLEAWRKNLPKEFEPRDGQLPPVLLMQYVTCPTAGHLNYPRKTYSDFEPYSMFFQLLFIHLYRPFLKYTKATSPLPAHVSPRRLCTQAASMISKLLRMYKRSYGLRQLCNVTVYIVHSACTIHLLNLPDKGAKRDIVHGLKNLEEIGEGWPCARRTIQILDLSAQKWGTDMPDEALAVLERCRVKYGTWGSPRPTQSPATNQGSPQLAGHSHTSPSTHCSTPDPMSSAAYQDIPRGVIGTDLGNSFMAQGHTPPSSSVMPPLTQAGVTDNQSFNLQDAYANPNYGVKLEENVDLAQSYNPATGHGQRSATPMIPQLPALSGVEHLLLGSQDWWVRDQSALALGLDNWDDNWDTPAQNTDVSMGFDPTLPPTTAPNTSYTNASQMTQPGDQFPGSLDMNVDITIPQSGYGSDYIMAPSNPQMTNPGEEMPLSHPPPQPQRDSTGFGQSNGNNLYY